MDVCIALVPDILRIIESISKLPAGTVFIKRKA